MIMTSFMATNIGAWWHNGYFDCNHKSKHDPAQDMLWRQNDVLTEFTNIEMKIIPRMCL